MQKKMNKIKNVRKKIKVIPYRIYSILLIKWQRFFVEKTLSRVRSKAKNGKKINVIYFVETTSIWKLDSLYNIIDKDNRFQQYLVVVPIGISINDVKIKEIEDTFNYFKNKGYNVYKGYDKDTTKYLNVNKVLLPDIIFHGRPYRWATHKNFTINKFLDKLNCYINYGTDAENIAGRQILRSTTVNAAWTFFIESEFHKTIYEKTALVNGNNAVVVGYPGIENLKYKEHKTATSSWKNSKKDVKRIIWAPHHSINKEDSLHFSNFLEYAETMKNLTIKYENEVVFSFKPHPSLKEKLYNREDWGKEKTDSYYNFWNNGNNTQLDDGPYEDLFNNSDALIHDSVSFIIEYLFVGKPTLFLDKPLDKSILNEFGQNALDVHYIANSSIDIEKFISSVVIEGNDGLLKNREMFYVNVLKQKEGSNTSKNIYNYLIKELELLN